MTLDRLADRDAAQVEALVADRYLDDLLAAGDRHATDVPADATLDPDLRWTVRLLRSSLVRVHPSFRFEERLAGRLADLAAARPVVDSAAIGQVLQFRAAADHPGVYPAGGFGSDPLLQAVIAGTLDPSDAEAVDRAHGVPADRRPLIVGGALTSAAISIVGVAWVAWRASRPASRTGTGTLGQVTRAAHARRAARSPLAGLGGPV